MTSCFLYTYLLGKKWIYLSVLRFRLSCLFSILSLSQGLWNNKCHLMLCAILNSSSGFRSEWVKSFKSSSNQWHWMLVWNRLNHGTSKFATLLVECTHFCIINVFCLFCKCLSHLKSNCHLSSLKSEVLNPCIPNVRGEVSVFHHTGPDRFRMETPSQSLKQVCFCVLLFK